MSKNKLEAASIRIYLQEGDRYLAILSVDRQLPEPTEAEPAPQRPLPERYTGSSETTVGAALASVLQISNMLEG